MVVGLGRGPAAGAAPSSEAAIRAGELKERLRERLTKQLPDVRFSFEPSDIVSRIMSFGAPTPIEVAVSGTNFADVRNYAGKLQANLAKLPMLRDLTFEQELDYPSVKVKFRSRTCEAF